MNLTVKLKRPHAEQLAFIESKAKRRVIRAGRRGGKTVGASILSVREFLNGRRILYATPTSDQLDRFWQECKIALEEPIAQGVFTKHETRRQIELPGTEQRIRAKTAWNADTLRGDYADLLILDEWQLMNEDAWDRVGAPMMLDSNGDVIWIYTPPSARTRSVTKATDPLHAAKLFKLARANQDAGDERWAAFHFSSHMNPHLSRLALEALRSDMSEMAYRMEIEAIDPDDDPDALWTRSLIERARVTDTPEMHLVVVAIDPPASTGQCGIIVAGVARHHDGLHGYVLEDASPPANSKPDVWGRAAVAAYHKWNANLVVGETNNGGDMIEHVLRSIDGGRTIGYDTVRATRGKFVRAEPVSTIFEQGRGHMVGFFPALEDQLCSWVPGDDSPDRLDAMVWAFYRMGLATQSIDWDSVSGLGTVENFVSRWDI